MKTIDVKTLTEIAVSEHVHDYDQFNMNRCEECGSSLFRSYTEPLENGVVVLSFCAICNEFCGEELHKFDELTLSKEDKDALYVALSSIDKIQYPILNKIFEDIQKTYKMIVTEK